jgi:hypothetical protein
MDNPELRISGETKERLAIAFSLARYRKAIGYAIHPEKGLILFWVTPKPESAHYRSFGFEMEEDALVEFIWAWLQKVDYNAYEEEPLDCDAEAYKTWLVYSEAWGYVAGWHSACVAILPRWGMSGK